MTEETLENQTPCLKKDDGAEPYIPSVHLKNVAPFEWLNSDDGKYFLEKLEKYESETNECLSDAQVQNGFLQQRIDATKCIKCGIACLQDGAGWLYDGVAKIKTHFSEKTDTGYVWQKETDVEEFEVPCAICPECLNKVFEENDEDLDTKLWAKIQDDSFGARGEPMIPLPKLYSIPEKYGLVKSEKNGM